MLTLRCSPVISSTASSMNWTGTAAELLRLHVFRQGNVLRRSAHFSYSPNETIRIIKQLGVFCSPEMQCHSFIRSSILPFFYLFRLSVHKTYVRWLRLRSGLANMSSDPFFLLFSAVLVAHTQKRDPPPSKFQVCLCASCVVGVSSWNQINQQCLTERLKRALIVASTPLVWKALTAAWANCGSALLGQFFSTRHQTN